MSDMAEPDPELLKRLWREHVLAAFPAALRGREVQGEDLDPSTEAI